MPDEDDRLEILKSLIGKIHMLQNLSSQELMYVAQNTAGFSGADLQAVLYTSQLKQLERNKMQDFKHETKTSKVEEVKKKDQKSFRKVVLEPNSLDWKILNPNFESGDIQENNSSINKGFVTLDDLLKAVKETRPSVSKDEVENYKKIYDKFDQPKKRQQHDQISNGTGTRITLA